MTNVLEVDSVRLAFGSKVVLQNVYLKSETGKITGLLGRNGSGKSCLMQIIFGELTPNNKSIRINGKALTTSHRSPQDMRYLPQNRFIPTGLTIKRVFNDFELNFTDFTTLFPNFKQFYKSKLAHLSGGERRLIEIYIILASPTKFCMLDEPFSKLMPLHIDTIKQLILREKENKGILITDHNHKHIADICDNVYVIDNRQVVME